MERGRPKTGRGKAIGTRYPDVSGYVSDGGEEPPVPIELDIIDVCALIKRLSDRLKEIDQENIIPPIMKDSIDNTKICMELIADKARKTLENKNKQAKTWAELHFPVRKLVDSQKEAQLKLMMQDADYPTYRPYLRAYSTNGRNSTWKT